MNPELPSNPREELELRVTALLLGELSDADAAAVRAAIAADPELQKLQDDLRQTIHLVRKATVCTGESAHEESAPLKLSEERRQSLMTAFVIPPLKPEHVKTAMRFRMTFMEVLVVLAIVAIIAAMSMPALSKAKSKAKSVQVMSNLRQIDGAKSQWALENNKSAGDDPPSLKDLKPYLMGRSAGELPPSAAGEKYVLGKVGEPVAAEMDANRARQFAQVRGSGPAAGGTDGRVYLGEDGRLSYADKSAAMTPAPGADSGAFVVTGSAVMPTDSDETVRGKYGKATERKAPAPTAGMNFGTWGNAPERRSLQAKLGEAREPASIKSLGPEPGFAPPPAEIVLPKSENGRAYRSNSPTSPAKGESTANKTGTGAVYLGNTLDADDSTEQGVQRLGAPDVTTSSGRSSFAPSSSPAEKTPIVASGRAVAQWGSYDGVGSNTGVVVYSPNFVQILDLHPRRNQ